MPVTRKPRINVLFALDKSGYSGAIHGGGRFFYNVVSRIDSGRFNLVPCILRGEDSLKSAFDKQGINVRYLRRAVFDPLVLVDLVRIIREQRIHVLHLNSFASQQFGRLAAGITGIPAIIHGHGVDYFPSWHQRALDLFLDRFTTQVITVSKSVKEDYIQTRKVDRGKVVVIPNGIPVETFTRLPLAQSREVKRRFGLELDHLVVGTITRLREEKGNRYLLEAAVPILKVFPKTYFLFVGEGPLLPELKSLARQLGIERKVVFTGFCEDVPPMLSIMDVKVMASLTEGAGLALLEAMAAGTPIVATGVGGMMEILVDGETGLLVPPKDAEAMASKIVYLLQHEEARVRLARAAFQASQRYSMESYISKLQSVYESVVTTLEPLGRDHGIRRVSCGPPRDVSGSQRDR